MATKMLSCREVGLRLQSYLDGEVDAQRREQIRVHLDACADCGLEEAAFTSLKASLRDLTTPIDETVLERLRSFSAHIAEASTDNAST